MSSLSPLILPRCSLDDLRLFPLVLPGGSRSSLDALVPRGPPSLRTGVCTPNPSHRLLFCGVLHLKQLPNDLEHRPELPHDYLCMHLGRSASERTQAQATGKSALVFTPIATSADHALCSHRTGHPVYQLDDDNPSSRPPPFPALPRLSRSPQVFLTQDDVAGTSG